LHEVIATKVQRSGRVLAFHPNTGGSATSSSASAEEAAEATAEAAEDAGMIFCFLLTTLGLLAPLLFFDYTVAVVFLAMVFLDLSSRDFNAFARILCSV
jgi:hypothetical protein